VFIACYQENLIHHITTPICKGFILNKTVIHKRPSNCCHEFMDFVIPYSQTFSLVLHGRMAKPGTVCCRADSSGEQQKEQPSSHLCGTFSEFDSTIMRKIRGKNCCSINKTYSFLGLHPRPLILLFSKFYMCHWSVAWKRRKEKKRTVSGSNGHMSIAGYLPKNRRTITCNFLFLMAHNQYSADAKGPNLLDCVVSQWQHFSGFFAS